MNSRETKLEEKNKKCTDKLKKKICKNNKKLSFKDFFFLHKQNGLSNGIEN